MTKIAVIGAAGRMGRRIMHCIVSDPNAELVAAVDAAGHPDQGRSVAELCGLSDAPDVKVTDSIPDGVKVDAAIDFSSPETSVAMAALAAARGFALVVGTTGLDKDQSAKVAAAAEKVPVIHAPNCSTGVNLMFRIAEQVAAALGDDYDIEIVESHHRFKKDAPSGTAIRLAERVAAGVNRNLDEVAIYGREGLTGERPRKEIAIHTLRRGDVVGEHTVSFTALGETIEITHRAHSRDAFAIGSVRAALFLSGKPAGTYTMDQVLGL